MMISLQPLRGIQKKRIRRENFCVLDLEASEWIKMLVSGHCDENEFHYFYTMKEHLDFLFDRTDFDAVYAHFGGKYDFLFVLNEVFKDKCYTIENMIPRGSGLLCFDLLKRYPNGQIKKISFKDSSALLPFSLRKLCESFKVEHLKLEIDYEKITKVTPELLKYLKHDCMGLYEVLKKYREWPLIEKAGHTSTMASQALRVLRVFLPQEIHSLNKSADIFVRRAYFGGRTEIFRPLFKASKKHSKLYCYDVNSLYPFVMRNFEYPSNFKHKTFDYEPKSFGFYDATVEVPKNMFIPPLPVMHEINHTKKLIFPTGKFKGRWTTVELEYAKTLGVKILETGQGMIFTNGGYIFKDFIDALYEMRLKAKKENDGVGDILTKLLMNSCYGRFGLNRKRTNLVVDDGSEGLEHYHDYQIGKNQVKFALKPTNLTKTFSNVSIAAWVTSLARVHMHKLLMQCQDEIYYIDTDSLFTTQKFEQGNELGQLKKEYECSQACFVLPKTYIAESESQDFQMMDEKGKFQKSYKKIVMKGFDKRKLSQFNFEDYMDCLEGEIRLKTNQPAKFSTFKTALKKNALVSMTPMSSKQIRSMYDKRCVKKVQGLFTTEPLHL